MDAHDRRGVSYARKVFGWGVIAWQLVLLVLGAALGRLDEVLWMMPFWLLLGWGLLHDWSRGHSAHRASST